MGFRPEQIVSDVGKTLAKASRPNKDFIIKSLRQTASALSELEQSPSLKPDVSPLNASLVKHRLLRHKDKDVRLLVAICVSEIIRVLAPEPPFSDEILRDFFKLMLCVFADMSDIESPYFSRRVRILETVAELKFCIQMLDIGCDDLILEMFNIFFSVVREDHQPSLVNGILSIMTLILKEEVSRPLLEVIFQNLLKEEGAPPASARLAVSVIKNCVQELEPVVCGFLISCISDKDAVESQLKEFYHKIIFEISQCAPQMLLAVIPSLTQELMTDQVDTRIKAVNLIGRLFALPGCHVAQEYRHLFAEFLKRFSDKSAEVRVNALQCAKDCYLTNPCGAESLEVLAALEGRLLDFDDSVRTQAVAIACDIARSSLKYVPADLISRVAERLRDKKISVRRNALRKLLEVYRDYCTMCSEAHVAISDQFEQIPCRILMLCYDKDCQEFRPQNLEVVLVEDLFPTNLSVLERTRHWTYLFSLFTPAHVKALNSILSQKRRLQAEMQSYLSLRMKEKYALQDVGSEQVQDRIRASFMKMSISFPDPFKAEECFYKLDQVKDNNIFDTLRKLLDEVTSINAQNVRDKLLKMTGDRHPLFDFLCSLSSKCSFNIFSSDHVTCILDDISSRHLVAHSISFLVFIVSIFPTLMSGSEKLFQELFEENPFNDKLIQILGIAGSHMSIKLSDIYPSLERICLEGTRTESKYAVSAIAALKSCPKQDVFSKLYKRLVDSLNVGKNIPTVLQSLGCVAQHSNLMSQILIREIKPYIDENIFRNEERSDDLASFGETSGCSNSCKMKIYGLKTLVKSFLPHKGNHIGCQITDLLDILSNMLQKGEVFDGTISCEIDKNHIRLAAANSVLRLSRRWDFHIYPQIFRSTAFIAKHPSSCIRRSFLTKTHKLLRERAISSRYACAFALAASDSLKDLQDDSLKYMAELIREHSREAQLHQTSVKQGESSCDTDHPAYIMVYLIHVLVHDTSFSPENCLDEEKYAHFCRPLYFALWVLVNASAKNSVADTVSYLLLIFRAIKKAEDAVDTHKTPMLCLLSDIGISILDVLNNHRTPPTHPPRKILLPSSIYRYDRSHTSEEDSLKCLRFYAFDQSFVRRVVDKLEMSRPGGNPAKHGQHCQEDGSCIDVIKHRALNLASSKQISLSTNGKKIEGKNVLKRGIQNHKNTRQETNTKRTQKQITSNNASKLVDSDCLMIDKNKDDTSGNSNPIPERAQLLSSCDSVTTKPSLKESQDLCDIDVLSSHSLNENDGTRNSSCIDEENAEYCRTELKDCCSKEGIMKRNDMLVQRNKSSSQNRSRDPGQHFSLTSLEETVDTFGDDTARLRETLPMKRNEKMFKQKLPMPAKRKKGQRMSVDPPASEVVDVNDAIVARRTRGRKA